MLVLQRRVGQRLFIGENIEIVIVYDHGGRIGVGIEAPKDVRIVREEIKDQPRKEKQ